MVTTNEARAARRIRIAIKSRLDEIGMDRKWLAIHLGWKRAHLDYLLRSPERITAVELELILNALGTTYTLGKEGK